MTGTRQKREILFELAVDLRWALDEIDSGTLRATPVQRAALAAAEQTADELYARLA